MKNDIDIVIPWVDGRDIEWIKIFNAYCPEDKRIIDVTAERYRDNGLLKYWFRGIEKYAPWIRCVHFVTCGQKPEWLNLAAPKLHWVKHNDYIPEKFLPVFSSHPIELMMHKIPDLAEKFIYFNDDLFLTAPVKESFFFNKGLPCDEAVMTALSAHGVGHVVINDLSIINSQFDKKQVLKRNPLKWFNPLYGSLQLRSLCLLPWPKFTGFVDFHFAVPFLKSTLLDVWENYSNGLENTVKNRFRSLNDVNQWLFRYWQICKGIFSPCNMNRGRKYFTVDDDISEITDSISKGKYKEIVLNDTECADYDERMEKIRNAFESLLPEKSSFEV